MTWSLSRLPHFHSCCSVWLKRSVLVRQGRLLHQLSLRPKSNLTNEEVLADLRSVLFSKVPFQGKVTYGYEVVVNLLGPINETLTSH
jgi:hypothetical protein